MAKLSDNAWADLVERARALAAPCALCAIRCGVDRLADERGRCGLAADTPIYSRMLHFGEEAHLVPSYVVNMSGCSMHCTFCSEDAHLRPPFGGRVYPPSALAATLRSAIEGQRHHARNINFVGGEPSISLHYLVEVAAALAREWPEHPPLLLNTNGLLTPEALAIALEVFDIFLVDLKFGVGECGWKVGKIHDYWETVTQTIVSIDASGAALSLRHLLMPGHVECCTRPALTWLEQTVPKVPINVMSGFVAFSGTRASRHWPTPLTVEEREQAREIAAGLAFERLLWDGGPLVA